MCGFCGLNRRRFGQAILGLSAAAVVSAKPQLGRATNRRLPTVMLDPGHGGRDPGAIAPDGVFEKTITLASGQALRKALIATGRYRVEMTRTDDSFIALADRVTAAVAVQADLFIAMHCDHLPEPNYRGASIYTLSAEASDGLAASVAVDENGADQFAGAQIAGVSPQVAGILASLETRATRISSANFAQDIQAAFVGSVALLPDPLRSANFAVLRDPSTPSTLLEMGCLTNPLDEKLLTSPRYHAEMADRLTVAIDLYFQTSS